MRTTQGTRPMPAYTPRDVRIPCRETWLYGDLTLPAGFRGVVIFVHGSGSSRHSARNHRVARMLHQAGIGTLLFDLLTVEEEKIDRRTREHRYDIALLAGRLQDVTLWAMEQTDLGHARIGYFSASTGCAAAMIAAARFGTGIAALVSRGGRPDLAGPQALAAVTAPSLLVVGGADVRVLDLNEEALQVMTCVRQLDVVPGARHLFEERGALDEVATRATDWFVRWLGIRQHRSLGAKKESTA